MRDDALTMVLPNNLLIVLLAVLVVQCVTAQNDADAELRANGTERTSVCEDPNKVPLFGAGSCISQAAYTAIFLASIILAGISFLMLIGLLILYCRRKSKSSSLSDRYSKRSSSSSSSGSSLSASTVHIPSTSRRGNQVARVLPLDNPSKSQTTNNYYDTTDPHTSSAPYTATKPVSKQPTPTTTTTTTVVHKQTEVHELAYRKPDHLPRSQLSAFHQPAARPNDRREKRGDDYVSPDEDKMTSQF